MKYRVNFAFTFGRSLPVFSRGFETLELATSALKSIADYTLFLQDKTELLPDYSTYGDIQEWDHDSMEWIEIDEDD